MPSEINTAVAHITSQTLLLPAVQSWEIYLHDQGRSPYTVKAFIGDMHFLALFIPPDRALGAITTTDLNHFLLWLQKERGIPCSPKSLARRITSIKAFFRWLTRSGVLLVDPAEKVLQQSVISPLPEVLTPDEGQKVLHAAQAHFSSKKADPRPYVLLKLLLDTAIKKGECLVVNLNHIDLDTPSGPILFVRYANPANRFKERKIALTTEWIDAYQEYLKLYDPKDTIFPWSPRRLEYILEDLGNEAGLTKHLSFDMCRWTSALDDWQNKIDPEKIRQKLGISKIQWREISLKLRQLSGEQITSDK